MSTRLLSARVGLCLFLMSAACRVASAVEIELTAGPALAALAISDPPTYTSILTAATTAAEAWEAVLHDPITVKFEVEISGSLPPSALGYFDVDGPGVTGAFAYTSVSSALFADATTPEDVSAVGALQTTPFVDMITNDTTSFGAARIRYGTAETFNSTLRLPRAQQKALGLLGATDGSAGADGTLVLSSASIPLLDFLPGDGISPTKLDATGIFMHEFGHGLGFLGGVDHIDFASNPIGFPAPGHPDDFTDDTIFTILDLYRYSPDSLSKPMQPSPGGVLDWAFGSFPPSLPAANPFFSIDGGVSPIAMFSTGAIFGDGFQAQHWKNVDFPMPSFGLMDPEIDLGELATIKALDILAMDVIGYNIMPIPEPATMVLALVALLIGAPLLRHQRNRARA